MKRKQNSQLGTKQLANGALIAAMYVVFTYISAFAGLASGTIQVRISEMLCILPVFLPEAIGGLFIGCLISNLLTGAALYDVLFGSVATLIGAIGAYLLRKLPKRWMWTATVPTILANALIVPLILIYVYTVEDAYYFLVLTVGIGEVIAAGVLGTTLYYIIERKNLKRFF